VTSGTPHRAAVGGAAIDPDRDHFQGTATMTLANEGWEKFWAAADSGELESTTGSDAADGGEGSDRESFLAGLMLERFDDDERWRELARTGRAL
jgi:hypothetical protein